MKIKSFILWMVFSSHALAQQTSNQVIISLNFGENIPTVEAVYQEGQLASPPANHLIAAFDTATPNDIKYLVQLRAYGDLKSLIEQKPNWNRAVFERSLILFYDENADMGQIESILTADPYIQTVSVVAEGRLTASAQANKQQQKLGSGNWHLSAINWSGANDLTNGFGNIGFVDTGSLPHRDEFASFNEVTSDFIGGGLNSSKAYSSFYQDREISELREIDETRLIYGAGVCDDFDNNPGDGYVFPDPAFTGHSTHVSGLLASRSADTPGVCQDCYLSGTQEVQHQCVGTQVKPIVNLSLYPWSLKYLLDSGVQTASMSLEFDYLDDQCQVNPNFIVCLVINDAKARNVALVAAAGNSRKPMGFPASDRDVIGVAGIQSDLQFWNESPTNGQNFPPLDPAAIQNKDDCPFNFPPLNTDVECGSNYSWSDEISPGVFVAERYRRIDVVAPARDVMSTLPLGSEYIPEIGDAGCTDMADGVLDGYGPCTGTSMATPIVAGIAQLIRSVNPLLPIGDDEPDQLDGVRDVLLYSGAEYQSTQSHNPWMGYGVPDSQLAVETVLGVSNGQLMKNRVTPLMVLHNESFNDTAYTVFPQVALAHALNASGFYTNPANIPEVNELPKYPVEQVDGEPVIDLVPLAPIYVMTTAWNPLTQNHDLDPLYRMTKEVVSDPGCIPGKDDPNTCYLTQRKTVMVTYEAELESFHAAGFELQGIEGYVIPCDDIQCNLGGGAIRIYRVYDDVNDSYYLTQFVPSGDYQVIGAGFLNWDFDGDGLTVGMEYLLGTSDNNPDSDGDDLPDGLEYPAAGVPFSDPMISDIIFEDGFE